MSEVAYNALLLINQQQEVIHMNAAARDLFGVFTIGDSLMAVTRHHEIDEFTKTIFENEENIGWQTTIRGAHYRVRALPIHTPGATHLAMVLEDVSELQRLGRARRDLVANISHDLRTPITSIRLLVDTLLRGAVNDPKQQKAHLKKVATETQTLHQMAQELLDLSMIESGRAEMILMPIELSSIIEEAVERLIEQAERSQVTIESQIPPKLKVLADFDQIIRVLTNLLHNAIKFTPPDGIINISVIPDGEWVCVTVTDTGPGIPREERERIFERFYRQDRARKKGGGTGLGLAIAKHIIEGHGGKIWAEDSPEGSGARICFTIPLA
jgi:two-component system phosphate regulon sensor histidine kinase PhoR